MVSSSLFIESESFHLSFYEIDLGSFVKQLQITKTQKVELQVQFCLKDIKDISLNVFALFS